MDALRSILGRREPQAKIGSVTINSAGTVSITGITPDTAAMSAAPSGATTYVAASSGVVLLPIGGDYQRLQGVGIGGWVVPS